MTTHFVSLTGGAFDIDRFLRVFSDSKLLMFSIRKALIFIIKKVAFMNAFKISNFLLAFEGIVISYAEQVMYLTYSCIKYSNMFLQCLVKNIFY